MRSRSLPVQPTDRPTDRSSERPSGRGATPRRRGADRRPAAAESRRKWSPLTHFFTTGQLRLALVPSFANPCSVTRSLHNIVFFFPSHHDVYPFLMQCVFFSVSELTRLPFNKCPSWNVSFNQVMNFDIKPSPFFKIFVLIITHFIFSLNTSITKFIQSIK